ncbi:probable methyltransferase-like protein 25 [Acomys russatus]|uniref:probable methyltransferase-like protein 25 n=1 Tax=Acomys russatus TaxID=60746 RepID=UPI0021E2A03A|nr:probable methyltransferase-like protein 25 [Acomys russatus]
MLGARPLQPVQFPGKRAGSRGHCWRHLQPWRASVMAAPGPLPRTPDLPTLHAKLQALLRFLRGALPISSAHTVNFYTESVWRELVDLPPASVLAALRKVAAMEEEEAEPGEALPLREAEATSGFIDLPKIFCETSQKLLNVEDFALAAKHYSVQNLELCTPFEQLLTALRGDTEQRTGENVKATEFMNTKKSHEVQAMSELICSIADYCGLKQIIDVGSGKGYLSSFLSLKYGLNVYGIDSSNTNTHGAKERNRKLKKHWNLYQPQSRLDVNGLTLKMPKEMTVRKEGKCREDLESVPKNSLVKQQMSAEVLPDFSEAAVSVIRKQQANLHVEPPEEENLCFENGFSLIEFLPIDAIEPTSSQVYNTEMSEVRRERRNVTSKPSDSSIYSPLTSFITADSELHDIIKDLEDCLMVGLHTCGDLAPNTLRIFASKSEVKGVCSVGCCYHLLSEEFENQHKEYAQENWGFPMCRYLKEERWCCGRNARMSACLALERVAVGQGLPTESLFYRAVLQSIIKDYYGISKCDRHVGKIYSKCSSFLDYVRMSLKKLGLDESKVSEEVIMDYYDKYKPRMIELEAFNMLKVVLAPCVETLILLDRLCYLKEQDDIGWSALVKLFDPVQSPRCYAVIALKKQCGRS